MAEHLTLKADLYERGYRDLPRTLPDARWRALVETAQYELDRPADAYLEGPLIPLVAGMRQLSTPAAITPVYCACLAECTVETQSSKNARFWSELLGGSQGDLGALWQVLGGDGAPGFLAYQGLLGSVGLGGGHATPLPWWMGDARHANGAFVGASTAALLSPAALKALLKAARAHGLLEIIKRHFTESAADPAAAPLVIEEHERLVVFLESALLRGDWILGRE
ncbi:MAG: hypothetical protein ABI193_10680 [Minicystis sp.]